MKHATAVNIAIHGITVLLGCKKALVEAIELLLRKKLRVP